MNISDNFMLWGYPFVSFLSAFLLFSIQPMVGKTLLPILGGAASIWTTLMLACTVLYYLATIYAHRWPHIHKAVLLASMLQALVIPFLHIPVVLTDNPIINVLLQTLIRIGLPFLTLAATSPIIQIWYQSTYPHKQPYFLYRYSNMGSLIGLLSYPLVFERYIGLSTQRFIWTAAYIAACSLMLYLATHTHAQKPIFSITHTGYRKIARWVTLSALPNIFTFAFTAYLTQNLTAAPFIWVLPLGAYLTSYILGFRERLPLPRYALFSLAILSVLSFAIALGDESASYFLSVTLGICSLFLTSLAIHHELYRQKPEGNHITSFYCALALGGVLAASVTGILAPLIFTSLWELPLILGILVLYLGFSYLKKKGNVMYKIPLLVTSSITILVLSIVFERKFSRSEDTMYQSRNFYGVTQVRNKSSEESETLYSLVNAGIEHGNEMRKSGQDSLPTTYYSHETGIGRLLLARRKQTIEPLNLGVIGLGAGTLSAYCEQGDNVRYYEINPQIIQVSEKYFSYNSSCRAKGGQVSLVPGDARQTLEKELTIGGSQRFDILVIDAFSGDAIPTHLLTQEAVDLYLQHLNEKGILAFHITNGYVNLSNILFAVAQSHKLVTYTDFRHYDWFFMTRDATTIHAEGSSWQLPPTTNMNPWTDDKSSILSVWK